METIVMSVGGSLIVPDQVDTVFLKELKKFIETAIGNGRRFVIIAGGGQTARRYQAAADEVHTLVPDDIDWIGIHATRLNGHLLRAIFKELAYPIMIENPDEVLDVPEGNSLIIAAGYRPGCSTDLRAVQMADRVGATKVVNLSNIDYVYTADPKVDPEAEPIEKINWSDFRKLLPEDWDPGLSSPFDPVAAREAESKGMEVACINGDKLEELGKYLAGEKFLGTLIR
ncbi:MAG: UMP kinase [Candidatus Paceibacterota bacterium]